MATTNIPSTARPTSIDAPMPATVNADEDIGDFRGVVEDAINSRADSYTMGIINSKRTTLLAELAGEQDEKVRAARLDQFNRDAEDFRKAGREQGMAVYEDAAKRRGRAQAAADQMQAALGLPMEAFARQREVERRSADTAAAANAQSGSGTFDSNLEGRPFGVDQGFDQYHGDQRLPEFNPAIRQGHGANIAAQIVAANTLMSMAPNAALTQENVNDPVGAAQRTQQGGPSPEPTQPGQIGNAASNESFQFSNQRRANAVASQGDSSSGFDMDARLPDQPPSHLSNVGKYGDQLPNSFDSDRDRREALVVGKEQP